MDNKRKDLSYFALRLKELLHISFPELANDLKFIDQRLKLAENTYEQAFLNGNRIDICTEIAEKVLFEDLHFSKFDLVFKVVCNEFHQLMADEELRPFSIKMLTVCETVFAQYTLTEEFADSPEFDILYTELTGIIQIWIEENGLQ
ncbi:DUF1896 family protein [Pedobacter alluvionis]|uniref:DUF1896 domain-containing protein n=1 Tax=Pedobacter alluvionis TaxID=475253 RepID=A0A497XY94_9SPHI|nr:DUF1896 family protein [Pedobacter alluvionis]RLJ75091.1 uncharacterized protein DUF1896 [Pedobacter alluvionis]TFB30198.1 DUF1896 domain-containing protein [Pedobacter alluvionis]